MISEIVKRYKQGVHPCMLWFLMHYYYDNETEAIYDGDHILVDTYNLTKNYVPLYTYGYQPLIDEFTELNTEEKDLLKQYIDQYK